MAVTAPARSPMPVWVKISIVIAAGLTYWKTQVALCASVHFNDFGKFYYGVASWRLGGSLYALSPASYVGDLPTPLTNLNPPQAMLLVWPFSFLPIAPAFAAWMVVNGLALIYVGLLLGRTLRWRPGFWQLAVLLMGAPTTAWLITGQLTGVLAVPLALAWRRWRAFEWFHGGVWFGAVLSIKPFLGLFVLWLAWRRNWAALGGTVAGAAASLVAGLLLFGPRAYADWFGALASVEWAWGAMNASVLGVLTRALTTTPYHAPLVVLPSAVWPLWVASAAVILVVVARRLKAEPSVDAAWFQLMAASLLVSPLGWTYYLWWLLPGLPRLLSAWTSALLLVPILIVALTWRPDPPGLLTVTLGSAYCWALLWAFARARVADGCR